MSKTPTIRIRARWLTYLLVVVLTAAVVAPATAFAAGKFTDVPDSNTFHGDISWLANAGVTKGCNPPADTLYCPNGNVSRAQMAAFLRRFARTALPPRRTTPTSCGARRRPTSTPPPTPHTTTDQ